ncbi:MAG: hypothetical protein ACKOX1_09340 [Ignavibacteria bacterium]
MMLQNIFAKDIHTYPTPKGIVRNQGQYPSSVFGYVHNGNAILWFDESGILIDVKKESKRHVFRINVSFTEDIQAHFKNEVFRINVMDGTGSPYQEPLYSGMEIQHEHSQIMMRYDISMSNWNWIISHGSIPNMTLKFEGAENIDIDNAKGIITVYADDLSYTFNAPLIEKGTSLYKPTLAIHQNGTVSCTMDEKSKESTLNVPVLFTSFIGGAMAENVNAVALDQKGNIYALGDTETPDFPVSTGAYDSPNAKPRDLFINKYDSTGNILLYSARIGGSQLEKGNALAVDTLGQVCITGSTTSTDFPTTVNSYQSKKTMSDEDVFIAKLNASGSALLYSTFLTGMTTDIAHGLALDTKGDIYITGMTGILNKSPHTFPKTAGSYDTSYNGGALDAFIAKINPGNNGKNDLIFSTVVGGEDNDISYKIVIARNGNVIIAGETASTLMFPITTGAIQTKHNGLSDGFVAMLTPAGDSLLYSTFLGGSGYERITGLVFDEPSSSVFFGGYTNSSGIPDSINKNPIKFPIISGSYDTTYNGGIYDAFLGKFEPSAGSALKFSSFLGGSGDDFLTGLGVDVCAAPYITGNTTSLDFPITDDAPDSTIKKNEAFISKLNALANVLVFSSYFGNDEDDQSNAIIVDGSGAIFIGGSASGSQLPGSNQSTNGKDGFIAKIQVGILPLKPVIDISGSLSFCKGDSVILDVTSRNLISYQWRKNASIIQGANSPILIVKETGLYTVDVADASGCTGSESVAVNAFDRPGLTIDSISVICPNDTIQLQVKTADSLRSIKWSPALGLSCTDCLNPLAYPPMTMVYTLLTIDTNGCSRVDTVKVFVIDSTALAIQNVADTMSICANTKGMIQFPIRNTSSVGLYATIRSFSDPLLTSNVDSLFIPADTLLYIPIDFAGRPDLGPKTYGITIADHCGTLKYAECIIDIEQPDFSYKSVSNSEICRTNTLTQRIGIQNNNALKGIIKLSANDQRVQFSKPNFYMNAFGIDSIDVNFKSDTVGIFPITIICEHECGNKDSITWNVQVIAQSIESAWKKVTNDVKSGMRFIQSFALLNQSNRPLNGVTTFDIALMHEQSSLSIDSIVSNDCDILLKKVGDSILIHYSNCKDQPSLQTNVHVRSVIGETLRPWLNIASFTSDDPCIDPRIQNASDTLDLQAYGCELTTLSIGKQTIQLIAVHPSSDQSMVKVIYESTEKAPIHIRCLSAVGQITHSVHIQDAEVGRHEVSIPLKGISSGIYALIFESNDYAVSSLFMIME